jgi:hypothetical protein
MLSEVESLQNTRVFAGLGIGNGRLVTVCPHD